MACCGGSFGIATGRPKANPHDYSPGAEGPAWTTDRSALHTIRLAKSGPAAMPGKTIGALFQEAVASSGDRVALTVERGADGASVMGAEVGTPTEWTFQQYYAECRSVAKSYIALGVEASECVGIIGFNSPEWFMADLGCVLAGGIGAGMYTTNSPEACQYIVEHSGARVVVCENQKQVDKFLEVQKQMPKLKTIVVWSQFDKEGSNSRAEGDLKVVGWADFLALGEAVAGEKVDARMEAQQPGNCCQLIYTSGTTGKPKAVMVSHDGVIFMSNTVTKQLSAGGSGYLEDGEERIMSYLPLSHVAGFMLDIVSPLFGTASVKDAGIYLKVFFARPDALKGTLPACLQAASPTVFLGVPRVWEKVSEGMKAKLRAAPPPGVVLKIGRWAKKKGIAASQSKQIGGDGKIPCCYGFCQGGIFKKVRMALGLLDLKVGFTGAAPITVETLEFFGQYGIQVNEVYGMSETTGVVTWSTDDCCKWGSCGYELDGVEIKIDHDASRGDKPGNGEICFRGRNIMMGYMANPDLGAEHVAEIEKKNREAIDEEGWMHSGDLGRVDDTGMYWITGRLKELLIGAGGENIAPVPIEDRIKALCPALSNVMMVGDQRKFNTMLVTLKAVVDVETGLSSDALVNEAVDVNSAVATVSAAINDPAWQKYIQDGIDAYNKEAISPPQRIQKFTVLSDDFSEAGGELTATFKLKRAPTAEKYNAQIEAMYSGGAKAASPAAVQP